MPFYYLFFIALFLFSCGQNRLSDSAINELLFLDQSLKKNAAILSHINEYSISEIEEIAKTRIQFMPICDQAKEIHQLGFRFNKYIDRLKKRLLETPGELFTAKEAEKMGLPFLAGMSKNVLNTTIPHQLFLTSTANNNIAEGPVLVEKISQLKIQYLQIIKDLFSLTNVDIPFFKDSTKTSTALAKLRKKLNPSLNFTVTTSDQTWTAYTFGNKPIVAIFPILSQFQNDILLCEEAILEILIEVVKDIEPVYNKFAIVAHPYYEKGSSIRLGESIKFGITPFEYASKSVFTVTVNGRQLPIVDGKAIYKRKPSSIGKKSYRAQFSVENPLTGEIETFSKKFYYEVGPARQ